jgi:hypothetical protein
MAAFDKILLALTALGFTLLAAMSTPTAHINAQRERAVLSAAR